MVGGRVVGSLVGDREGVGVSNVVGDPVGAAVGVWVVVGCAVGSRLGMDVVGVDDGAGVVGADDMVGARVGKGDEDSAQIVRLRMVENDTPDVHTAFTAAVASTVTDTELGACDPTVPTALVTFSFSRQYPALVEQRLPPGQTPISSPSMKILKLLIVVARSP